MSCPRELNKTSGEMRSIKTTERLHPVRSDGRGNNFDLHRDWIIFRGGRSQFSRSPPQHSSMIAHSVMSQPFARDGMTGGRARFPRPAGKSVRAPTAPSLSRAKRDSSFAVQAQTEGMLHCWKNKNAYEWVLVTVGCFTPTLPMTCRKKIDVSLSGLYIVTH